MKKAIALVALLGVGLAIALVIRVVQLRAAGEGPPGGTGVIEGVDVDVTSRIAARIAKVRVREGAVVRVGEALVDLDCSDQDAALAQIVAQLAAAAAAFRASQEGAASASRSASAARSSAAAADAQVAALEAQAHLARLELARVRDLVGAGAVPAAELDAADARHATIAAQLAAQRATGAASRAQAGALSSAGGASRAQATAAERNLDAVRATVTRAELAARECTLLAPRDGMIATRVREPGEAVLPGSVVLTITDLAEARTRFYLPNSELAAAAPGRAVRVRADAYPDEVFSGTIFHVSPHAEFTPRNVQTRQDRERLVYAVEVRIANADLRLRAGMPVEVSIGPAPAAATARRDD